jgi:DNA mismatch repair protein MutS
VAALDLSTGEFSAAEYAGVDGIQALADELAVLKPREIVVPAADAAGQPSAAILAAWQAIATSTVQVTPIDEWMFDVESARRVLLDQLQAGTLDGFGLDQHPAAVAAAGALIHYLRDTQKVDLAHVRAIAYRQRADGLLIDPTTLKHLEILEGADGGRDGSLLNELDRTVTSMGSRLLRAWLLRPLVALEPIRDRLDAVEELAYRSTERGKLREAIKSAT